MPRFTAPAVDGQGEAVYKQPYQSSHNFASTLPVQRRTQPAEADDWQSTRTVKRLKTPNRFVAPDIDEDEAEQQTTIEQAVHRTPHNNNTATPLHPSTKKQQLHAQSQRLKPTARSAAKDDDDVVALSAANASALGLSLRDLQALTHIRPVQHQSRQSRQSDAPIRASLPFSAVSGTTCLARNQPTTLSLTAVQPTQSVSKSVAAQHLQNLIGFQKQHAQASSSADSHRFTLFCNSLIHLTTNEVTNSDQVSHHSVYQLLHALYSETTGTKSLPQWMQQTSNVAYAEQYARKQSVSAWLQQEVAAEVQQQIRQLPTVSARQTAEQRKATQYHHILLLLTAHRIEAAVQACIDDAQDTELGIYISQAGQSPLYQHDMQQLIRQWRNDGTFEMMPTSLRLIYRVLAGEVRQCLPALYTFCKQQLSWQRALALIVWYTYGAQHQTLTQAMNEYTTLLQSDEGGSTPIPFPTPPYVTPTKRVEEISTLDVRYNLLAMYCNTDAATHPQLLVECLLPSGYSSSLLNTHLAYYIGVLLSLLPSPHNDHDYRVSAVDAHKLTVDYISQLESLGLWYYALYVAQHPLVAAEDDIEQQSAVDELLQRYASNIQLPHDVEVAELLHVTVTETEFGIAVQGAPSRAEVQLSAAEQQSSPLSDDVISVLTSAVGLTLPQLYTAQAGYARYTHQPAHVVYTLQLHAEDGLAAHETFLTKLAPALMLTADAVTSSNDSSSNTLVSDTWHRIATECQRLRQLADHASYVHGAGVLELYYTTMLRAQEIMRAAAVVERDAEDTSRAKRVMQQLPLLVNLLRELLSSIDTLQLTADASKQEVQSAYARLAHQALQQLKVDVASQLTVLQHAVTATAADGGAVVDAGAALPPAAALASLDDQLLAAWQPPQQTAGRHADAMTA